MAPQAAQPSFLATGRGKLTLTLLCAIAFLDFIDASIINVALPAIRSDLGFSVQDLQWVPSGYLLTYGGFMLLGGRLADLLGRRRVVVAGTVLFSLSSVVGGLANTSGMLVGARLAQGAGAAMMLPGALSILTTMFKEGGDRTKALSVWGGVAGGASAAGVLLGGLLTDGPGWRWVMWVNVPVCVLVIAGLYLLVEGEKRTARLANFDILGTVLVTGSVLLLVYSLVKAPDVGWGANRTIGGLTGAAVIMIAFLLNERRSSNPLLPLSIFRIRGLGAADVTQLVAVAGFLSMFFFLSLYMENVLGYSPMKTGSAYLPLCVGVGMAAGIASQLIPRIGTRPLLIVGLLLAGGGIYWLSRIPVDGHYLGDLLPGLMVTSFGLGFAFVSITTAANANVEPERAGLAAALLNASQQIGGALGLAIFSAVATSRTDHLVAHHTAVPQALTSGFSRALLVSSFFLFAAAIVALRAANSRGEVADTPAAATAPEPATTR
ncbi:MFS transporter [Actinacidiphila bryophytorum]|uniref:DHA2 family efflux MFS transporter permease subunit n=1 Tax=Actinacidiphila bryophytorum TaxID=1436133 RepID=A0A9W4H344_9ACTN|nr:MFS transporter [Actinacidiphila bryophytorum]MBM9437179.1 MFS transporter [Actinacidiphila bryophytorum]MBN6546148.1 MFS transporter [Actinacidiphila bryophytorum]CAG7647021.1 DHA2 family efflux MFS transporter permease subunit [Actinacidiphila bryophytorum]